MYSTKSFLQKIISANHLPVLSERQQASVIKIQLTGFQKVHLLLTANGQVSYRQKIIYHPIGNIHVKEPQQGLGKNKPTDLLRQSGN